MSFADKLKDPKTIAAALKLAQKLQKTAASKSSPEYGSTSGTETLGSLSKRIEKLSKGHGMTPGALAKKHASVAGSPVVGKNVAGSKVVNAAPKKKRRDGIAQTGLTKGRMV
jgi:hypothetical protein